MSMVVAHNLPAINAGKNLYINNRALNKSIEKLSSGYRINVGQDGPADLVISEQLRAQAFGLERAVRNTTESINVLSIAEGALNEMNSILKKMKALAIHASNNGITSPDQIAADQSEMDSGIQTLERISNVTKFSDQFLLNGSKDLTYNVNTTIKGTQNNQLVNTGLTNFQQIFKRDGYQVSIGFTGAIGANSTTNIGNAAMNRQATKGYLEIDAFAGTKSQITEHGILTKGQSFILTGTLGSRQFKFSEGATVGEIVSAIKNVAGSTGVDASLVFNRTQTINMSCMAAAAGCVSMVSTACAARMSIYDNYTIGVNGGRSLIANSATIASGCVVYGKNTDGQGNIYVKVIGSGADASYELYKDFSLSRESLIGTGVGDGTTSVIRNNSGLELQIDIANSTYGDVFRISLGNISLGTVNACVSGSGGCMFIMGNSTASGVRLGVNTDSAGKIYFKTVYETDGCHARVYAYNNALMRQEDMVAMTMESVDLAAGEEGNSILLDSIWNDERTANTGLGLTLALATGDSLTGSQKSNAIETMEVQFLNLGARISTAEYGSNQFIKVQTFEGGIFVDYEDPANYDSTRLLERNTVYEKRGQDATITVNGQQMKTNGLTLDLATPDIMADVVFSSGHTGTTTLAQVGYNEGSIFSKATSLTLGFALNGAGLPHADTGSNSSYNQYFSALLNNACHVTNETIMNFQGGMQLQLGEGSGDQERTIIALKSMATAQLGRIEVTKRFDPNKAVIETRTLSIQDAMGGQLASLSTDPITALAIIEKAIKDVSEQRATIGAVQANMLQTNENNLRVTIENITKTESNIRDTDMAAEMTEFTRDQVLSQAGISMMTQANAQAQSVLSLLQG
ncbi:MAG: hypothetical protein LBU64_13195 [Planctomycetota bacterium]|jgi:flagellin|nr:hypothetical protein [Planctomycetota bacterium]